MSVSDHNAYGGGAEGSGNYGDVPAAPDPCAQLKSDMADARVILRMQITAWRQEGKTWAWINNTFVGKAYYGPLHGK